MNEVIPDPNGQPPIENANDMDGGDGATTRSGYPGADGDLPEQTDTSTIVTGPSEN